MIQLIFVLGMLLLGIGVDFRHNPKPIIKHNPVLGLRLIIGGVVAIVLAIIFAATAANACEVESGDYSPVTCFSDSESTSDSDSDSDSDAVVVNKGLPDTGGLESGWLILGALLVAGGSAAIWNVRRNNVNMQPTNS